AAEQLNPTFERDRLDDIDHDTLKAGAAQKPWEPWTDVGVGPAALYRLGVQFHESTQGGAVGLGEMPTEVDVLDHDDTTRSDTAVESCEQGRRIGEVREQETRIDDVEAGVRFPRADVTDVERHVREPVEHRFLPCQLDLDPVEIDTEHPSRRA